MFSTNKRSLNDIWNKNYKSRRSQSPKQESKSFSKNYSKDSIRTISKDSNSKNKIIISNQKYAQKKKQSSQIKPELKNKEKEIENNHKNQDEDNISFISKHLQFNINDDMETVINKNSLLRQKLVESQERINQLNLKIKRNEETYSNEKKEIDKELERISKNYKLYADSHLKLLNQKGEYDDLKLEKEHNLHIISMYQEFINTFLLDYIHLFEKLNKNKEKHINSDGIFTLVNENIKKYRNTIDCFNFPEIFQKYQNILKDLNKNKDFFDDSDNKLNNISRIGKENKINNYITYDSNSNSDNKDDDKQLIGLRIKENYTPKYNNPNYNLLKVKKNESYLLKYIDEKNDLVCIFDESNIGYVPLSVVEIIN